MAEPYRPVPSGAALTWVGIVVSWGAAAAALIGAIADQLAEAAKQLLQP